MTISGFSLSMYALNSPAFLRPLILAVFKTAILTLSNCLPWAGGVWETSVWSGPEESESTLLSLEVEVLDCLSVHVGHSQDELSPCAWKYSYCFGVTLQHLIWTHTLHKSQPITLWLEATGRWQVPHGYLIGPRLVCTSPLRMIIRKQSKAVLFLDPDSPGLARLPVIKPRDGMASMGSKCVSDSGQYFSDWVILGRITVSALAYSIKGLMQVSGRASREACRSAVSSKQSDLSCVLGVDRWR